MLALTHETTKLPPDRNQSIDFQSKSVDWFLYDGVNGLNELTHVTSRNYRQFINALNLENYDKHFQHLRTVKTSGNYSYVTAFLLRTFINYFYKTNIQGYQSFLKHCKLS